MDPISTLTEKHFSLLESEYGYTKEELYELIDRNDNELDELIDALAVDEPDDELVEELVDAICDCFEGPEEFVAENDQYGIQPIASSRDERHIEVMVTNYKSRFEYLDEDVIRRTLIKDIKPEDRYYAFVELQSGNCVGFGSLKQVSDECLEVGYEIIHDMQRQGVGGECIPMFIDFLREVFDEELIAKVYSDNAASIKILENAGAIQIGSEESDYAKFIKRAADLYDPDLYADAVALADKHYIVTYRL